MDIAHGPGGEQTKSYLVLYQITVFEAKWVDTMTNPYWYLPYVKISLVLCMYVEDVFRMWVDA